VRPVSEDRTGHSRINAETWPSDYALIKELYAGRLPTILMLDEALNKAGTETEVEDILGEAIFLPTVNEVLGQELR
jgi:hypothetical protein